MAIEHRWAILDALYRAKGVAAQTLYDDELAGKLGVGWSRLREDAEYLDQRGFLQLTRTQSGNRIYARLRLTPAGIDLIEGRTEDAAVPSPDAAAGAAGPVAGWSRAGLRRLLDEAFGDEELTDLCFDHFPAVYSNFAAGMSKGQKIRMLLDYCFAQGQAPALLDAVREANPEQYARYEAATRAG
jgi:hypothetical protein